MVDKGINITNSNVVDCCLLVNNDIDISNVVDLLVMVNKGINVVTDNNLVDCYYWWIKKYLNGQESDL